MPSDVTTGIFTLAGAFLGSAGTLAVTALTVRTQRALARDARDQTILDRQYADHREYLLRSTRMMEAANAVVAVTHDGDLARNENAGLLHGVYLAQWLSYAEAHSAAHFACPEEILAELTMLHTATMKFGESVDAVWAAAFTGEGHESALRRWEHEDEEVRTKRTAYSTTVVRSFGRMRADRSLA
ncbi:hypothetical protein ACQP06_18825 [Nocardia sp. CA-136227]|uniref:hypothetical protein n=1 Tax=Nocardia sp. CA-136227 TaxID=3239979 RepID=UPI003D967EFD